MAGYIKIIQTPAREWLPSANPILYTIMTSNPYTRLSYYIDVNINGNAAARLKYPVYDRNELTINLQRIVNTYLDDVFVNDITTFTTSQDESCSLQIKVTEEYWDGTQMFVDTAGATASLVIYIWRSAADFHNQRRVWDWYKKFDLMSNTGYNRFGKFLGVKNWVQPSITTNTYQPSGETYYIGRDYIFENPYKIGWASKRTMSFFTFSAFTNGSKHTQFLNVWCYNKEHKLTKTFQYQIHNATYSDATYRDRVGSIPVGAEDLNNLISGTATLYYGVRNYIDSNEDKYYFVSLSDNGNTQLAPGVTMPASIKWVCFEIVPCDRFEVWNILYKTAEGGWWQIRCDRKHTKETEVKTNIKHNVWGQPAYNVLPNDARFKQVMHTQATGTWTLNTDWIDNQGIVDEIEEMIKSPSIYLVGNINDTADPTYLKYIPVILKDSTYQIYDKEQDRLFKYEFEFEEAFMQPALV